ncbi:hypothetical protein [Arthrobacter sp. NPDC092385]|uniref:hypothetical protein n=1 Tax=Arthrobacter sp. NPDC092385 TaxID=3363943 RepID=UPI00382622EA
MIKQSIKHVRTAGVVAAVLLVLPACSDTATADPEAWATALEDVPGVTSADVEFGRYGPGNQADVTVRTATNDSAELEQILRESVAVFVDVTADMDTFALDYSVRTADGTRALHPEGIGWDSSPITFLRDDVAEADG